MTQYLATATHPSLSSPMSLVACRSDFLSPAFLSQALGLMLAETALIGAGSGTSGTSKWLEYVHIITGKGPATEHLQVTIIY